MSKIAQFTAEGYASPDVVNPGRTVLTFKISVLDAVIEGGFVEKFAQMKNWNGEGSACAGINDWLKEEATRCGLDIYVSMAVREREQSAREEFLSNMT